MTYTFVSLTNRKVAREKIVEGHSTKTVHQELSTYPLGGSHEATGSVTPLDKYAEAQSLSDCYAAPTRRSRLYMFLYGNNLHIK